MLDRALPFVLSPVLRFLILRHTPLGILMFCLFFLCPIVLRAQVEAGDGPAIFRELRALDGIWFMPTDRGDRLEIWRVADDSTYLGRALRIKPENGDTVNLETLRLELRGDTITYYAIARGQNRNQPIAFRLTNADLDGYLFENPKHDDPKKILYRLLGNREMQVTTEGTRNGRTVKDEYVFEREFTPGAVEFRIRAGLNVFSLNGVGQFPADISGDKQTLDYAYKPGWELGATTTFNGRGGHFRINVDLGLSGRFSAVNSSFYGDTVTYIRKGTYNTTWLNVAVVPELKFKRDGRLSLLAGPYIGFLLGSRLKGDLLPDTENKLFKANNDFKKLDLGLAFGLQYRLNFGKKDVGGIIGLRGNLGLKDLDNLYSRDCDNPAFCNGQVKWRGAAVYYSVNLLKL